MKEYVVTLHGIEHTVLLNADDAKKLHGKPVETKASTPLNKSRGVSSADSAQMRTKG